MHDEYIPEIVFGSVPQYRNEYGQQEPIPPWPYVAPGPFQLKTRLRLITIQDGAEWYAGRDARVALNYAPCQPFLRAIVKDFSWAPPPSRDTRGHWLPKIPREKFESDMVAQYGKDVINWQARVVEPILDALRDVFNWIYERNREWMREPAMTQGGLSIQTKFPMPPPETFSLNNVPPVRSGAKWFYNHLLIPIHAFAYSVFRRILDPPPLALAIAVPDPTGTWILDPEHPTESVQIFEPALLWHRLPGDPWRRCSKSTEKESEENND